MSAQREGTTRTQDWPFTLVQQICTGRIYGIVQQGDVTRMEIKACILKPGCFETDWRNSFVKFDQYPAHKQLGRFPWLTVISIQMPGDPEKGAKTILRLSRERRRPMRVPLGSDAPAIVKTKAEIVTRDVGLYAGRHDNQETAVETSNN